MYLAYFDESGDDGLVRSPTTFFNLACVLVHETKWLEVLDSLVDLRKKVRDKFGIPTRAELKGAYFKNGGGPFRGLNMPIAARMKLFSGLLAYPERHRLPLEVFAVSIHKANAHARGYSEPRKTAWKYAFERVHTFCRYRAERAMIFPDEGHGFFIRRLMRELRRHHTVPAHWGEGFFNGTLDRLIEDPNDRKSHESYLSQLADLCAYAAHRSRYIDPSNHVPPDAWDQLGSRRVAAVNRNTGGPPGIKVWP